MVVLFGVSIGDGHAVNGSYDGSIPRSATRNNKACRKLYSFRELDYNSLERKCAYTYLWYFVHVNYVSKIQKLLFLVSQIDSDQVFTGMAYDPHSGIVFLSSPKVSGRRAAVSFFRVDQYKPGSNPKLTAYPQFTSEPEVSETVFMCVKVHINVYKFVTVRS